MLKYRLISDWCGWEGVNVGIWGMTDCSYGVALLWSLLLTPMHGISRPIICVVSVALMFSKHKMPRIAFCVLSCYKQYGRSMEEELA